MKKFVAKRNLLFRNSAKSSNIPIHYSKADFFYEGQECRSDEKIININVKRTEVKEKKRDRFFGNFNMFF